jgi:hypothetical protein
VSIASGTSRVGLRASTTDSSAPLTPYLWRDLCVRTTISGNSLADELGRYLNIDETTFGSAPHEGFRSHESVDTPTLNEQALAAILDVVVTNSNASFECVRVPEPEGGVQEWWARMLSGTINTSQSELRDQYEFESHGL